MTVTVTTARQAVKHYYKNDSELLKQTDVIVARLSGAWNRTQGKSPAGRFIEIMAAAEVEIESQKQKTRVALPCKPGCHHCCVQEILVHTSEAVLLVKHIEQQMPLPERNAAIERIRALGISGETAQSPCAMLTESGTCSAYASRPMACRSYLALSEPACRTYRQQRGEPPEVFKQAVAVDAAVREVSSIFRRSGKYELNGLLRRIYSDPKKAAAWALEQPTDESDLART